MSLVKQNKKYLPANKGHLFIRLRVLDAHKVTHETLHARIKGRHVRVDAFHYFPGGATSATVSFSCRLKGTETL